MFAGNRLQTYRLRRPQLKLFNVSTTLISFSEACLSLSIHCLIQLFVKKFFSISCGEEMEKNLVEPNCRKGRGYDISCQAEGEGREARRAQDQLLGQLLSARL